jgi:hypothetical protein
MNAVPNAFPLAVALLAGCGATRAIAPLERGQHQVYADLGGPLVKYGSNPIPVPFANVGWAYGIDGRSNVHAAVNPASAAILGVPGVNAGYAREVLSADGARPRVMLDSTAWVFFGDNKAGEPKGGTRWFQDVSAIATWDIARRNGGTPHRVYTGWNLFVQPLPELHAAPVPLLGTELRVAPPVGLQLETAWWGFHRDTFYMVPEWVAPGQQGALAVRLGVNVTLPGKRP